MELFKQICRYILPFHFYELLRSWAYHTFELKHFDYQEYKSIITSNPKQQKLINFKGTPLIIADSQSFLFMHKEIFVEELYKFDTTNKSPYIIDCGANIGLGTLYFKHLYPDSEILAFEPDPEVFKILETNIKSHNLTKVNLENKALSAKEGVLDFYSEGSDAGRLNIQITHGNRIQVQSTKLSKYITRHVDFLKIDIEGSETEVVKDVQEKLPFVERIFIEYHSFIDSEFTLDVILSILKESGFKIQINAPGVSSMQPFIKTLNKYGMDMQVNIYAIKL